LLSSGNRGTIPMTRKPTYEELKQRVKELEEGAAKRKQAEKELQESKQEYGTLIENSLTGIYIDQDEKIVFANNKFVEVYRYPREELIGIETWRLVHPEDRALTNEIRAKRLKGEDAPSEYEARGLTKDGETICVKRRNALIEYKAKPAILGNIVDITKQKRAEEELRKKNEELKNFVDVVSHDLKTPIISIQGFSSRLLNRYEEKLGDEGRRYLEQIKVSARRMEAMVSDLLTLSRIGRLTPIFRNVPSVEIVRNLTSALQDRLKENKIEFVVADNLPTIYCDEEGVYEVLENLLVNAIKFVKGAKNPKIEIRYADRGDPHQFCLRDNGIGIDPKNHRVIFEMFSRLKEIDDEEGTGLGLAIVDRIVHNHGGNVWVESEKGKGATFCFTLPKA
jgi:PAS domain S-box-containing protein